jgi:hypothetical protein
LGHKGERVFAGSGVIQRHKVGEARGLALRSDVIDPVKFHAAPLFSACQGHPKAIANRTEVDPNAM